jgi:hypothetical protein
MPEDGMLVFTAVAIWDLTTVTILFSGLLDGEIQPSARFQVLIALFVELRLRGGGWW